MDGSSAWLIESDLYVNSFLHHNSCVMFVLAGRSTASNQVLSVSLWAVWTNDRTVLHHVHKKPDVDIPPPHPKDLELSVQTASAYRVSVMAIFCNSLKLMIHQTVSDFLERLHENMWPHSLFWVICPRVWPFKTNIFQRYYFICYCGNFAAVDAVGVWQTLCNIPASCVFLCASGSARWSFTVRCRCRRTGSDTSSSTSSRWTTTNLPLPKQPPLNRLPRLKTPPRPQPRPQHQSRLRPLNSHAPLPPTAAPLHLQPSVLPSSLPQR